MRGIAAWRALLVACAATAVLVFWVGSASAQGQFHGIAFTKGCSGPTPIGQPYNCAYQILNVVDQGSDTLMVSGLVDVVHAASGDVNSGNILGALQLVFSSPSVVCIGGSGAGTAASPYIGATSCTLPFGTSITTNSHSFYTVQAGDFALPGHQLTDTATLNWNNTCTAPGVQNCTTGPQQASAGSSTIVQQLPSSTTTQIHDAAHTVVTAVGVGTTVHDFVTVAGQPGAPVPTGNVNIDWFTNGTCTAPAAANSGSVGPLNAAGQFDATAFAFTVNTTGAKAFQAHYEGDGAYLPSTGPCEPLQVVDANIQITPAQATNPVTTNHTLTGHVNVDSGAGFANAPDGTVISFSLTNAGGASAVFVGPSTCTTAGGTGSCTVVISSPTAGTTTIHASTDVSVGGVSLHRETNNAAGNSGDATKLWINPNANIQVTPATADNPTGTNHTLTGHVNVAPDGVNFVNAPDGTVINFSLTNSGGATATFVGPSSCTTAGGTGSCTVVISSPTGGQTTVHASTDVVVNGVTLHRETDGTGSNSGNAIKNWIPPGGLIAPTQTTCSDVLNNTASTLGAVNYSVTGGKIGQGINPGVFFYYAKITTTTPNQVVTVTETNTSTNNAANFQILNGQAWLWSGDCSSKIVGTTTNSGGASFTVPVPGNYIIGIKYDTKSIAGTTAPVPADITYTFTSSLGATTSASVLLHKSK